MSRSPHPSSLMAEAAAWLARVHADDGDDARTALDAWLVEDPAHAAAFARAEEAWAILPRAAEQLESKAPLPAAAQYRQPAVLRPAAAIAAAIVVALASVWWWAEGRGAYVTQPGEQKVAMLDDGSRIALNTDTRLDVQFNTGRRQIRLDRGEAMFEVAHDAERPFVVIAGDTRVQALGTSFIVRRTADDIVVTLIKGRVAVTRHTSPVSRASDARLELRPGERLTEPENGPARIEPTSVEAATAWRRGQTVFDDTPLGIAVGELNRYGGPRIVIDDPRVAALPISGVYAANAADFAEAIAALHGLRVERSGEELHIRR